MKKQGVFGAVMKLTRIEHSLILAIAVVAAEIISGFVISAYTFLIALVPPILVSMGAFAINDYFDIDVDRKNRHYGRPLVNGSLKPKQAIIISLSTLIIGVAASAFINMSAFIITIVFAILSYVYSYRLKEVLLVGNVFISLTMVIPFIYGSFVVSETLSWNIILISIIVFLGGLAREIHGMVRDAKGDVAARKIKNVVYHIGRKNSNIVALILYLEAIAVSVFMFFFMRPFAGNAVYIVPILAVDIVIFYNSIVYFTKASSKTYRLSRNMSLAAMSIAVLVFIVSSLVYIPI